MIDVEPPIPINNAFIFLLKMKVSKFYRHYLDFKITYKKCKIKKPLALKQERNTFMFLKKIFKKIYFSKFDFNFWE